jgi:hypothetical protein
MINRLDEQSEDTTTERSHLAELEAELRETREREAVGKQSDNDTAREIHRGRLATGARPNAGRTPRRLTSRMSRLVIVLTVTMEKEEGHRSYPSQSVHPAKGPTVGGGNDDPRGEHTRNAPARHAART